MSYDPAAYWRTTLDKIRGLEFPSTCDCCCTRHDAVFRVETIYNFGDLAVNFLDSICCIPDFPELEQWRDFAAPWIGTGRLIPIRDTEIQQTINVFTEIFGPDGSPDGTPVDELVQIMVEDSDSIFGELNEKIDESTSIRWFRRLMNNASSEIESVGFEIETSSENLTSTWGASKSGTRIETIVKIAKWYEDVISDCLANSKSPSSEEFTRLIVAKVPSGDTDPRHPSRFSSFQIELDRERSKAIELANAFPAVARHDKALAPAPSKPEGRNPATYAEQVSERRTERDDYPEGFDELFGQTSTTTLQVFLTPIDGERAMLRRDHFFRWLKETKSMTPAAMRDVWNELPQATRERICPSKPAPFRNKNERRTVKTGCEKAEGEPSIF